jgi:hypothetical protein
MADYYPLISRAVAGLENSTGEARRAMYERARSALIAQLRGVEPPLSESDITRERLALEEAVRKVEAEVAKRARVEPPPPKSEARAELARAETEKSERPAQPQGSRPGDALRGPLPRAPAREGTSISASTVTARAPQPMPDARRPNPPRPRPPSGEDMRGSRDAAQSSRLPRRSFSAAPEPQLDRLEPALDARAPHDDYYNETTGEAVRPAPTRPRSPRPDQAPRKAKRSTGGLLKSLLLVGIALLLIGGGIFAWPKLRPMIASLTSSSPPATTQKNAASAERPKIPDRVGQPGQQVAPVAQRVVLYDEDPANPQGKQFVGTVVWRLDSAPGAAGQPADVVVRADVEIPDRKFKMSFSMRRNNDPGLPASHTAELSFQLPPDFDGGSVQNVPGILMKQNEQTRGTPLAGLAVKVTDGFFLVGLSNVETDRQRNLQLMRERTWFDVPMVYANNRRAILAIEKGSPGERAFADAFAAWGQ